MKKRLLACILSLVMIVSLLPTAALAADEEPGGAVCTCEALCTEGTVDENCPVCAEDYALCAYGEAPVDEGESTPCTVTEGCTLEDGHDGECVLPGEPKAPADDPADVPGEDGGGDNDTIGIDPGREDSGDGLTAVEQLAEMIAALPDYADVDETDLSGIYAAQSAYEALSDDEKASVDADLVAKLEDLAELAAEIEEILKAQAEQGEIEGTVYLADRGETVEVTVAETGTLQALVEATDGYAQESVTGLTISTKPGAFLNYNDFSYMRQELPNLRYLDLSDADCLDDYDPANPVEHCIPQGAMDSCATLVTLILPTNGVTAIGAKAFYKCSALKTALTIPGNIETIGANAFAAQSNKTVKLDGLTIAEGVKTIGTYAFYNRPIDGSLEIPASVEDIGFEAFKFCGFNGTLTFAPNSHMRVMNWNSFYGCKGFTGPLTFPDAENLKVVGGNFAMCTGFTGDLIIPDNVTTLGTQTFYGCTGLSGNMVVGSGVSVITSNTFTNMKMTGTLTLHEGVTKILDLPGGFTGNLVLPNGLTEIGSYVFNNRQFDSITLPDTLEVIGDAAFWGFKGTICGPSGTAIDLSRVTKIGSRAFSGCTGLTGPVTFGASLSSLGTYAFENCSNLTGGLNLSNALTKIPTSAFTGCKGLDGTLTLPDSIVAIENGAFSGCANLKGTLTIPASVTTIGPYAFNGCASLTGELTIPDAVTTIGDRAFFGCNGLSGTLTIGASVSKIAGYAFYLCSNIESIAYHGNQPLDLSNATIFQENKAIKSLDFSNSGITKLTFTGRPNLEEVDLTGCMALTDVNLQNNAIDFSGGKAKEWLDSYRGQKIITGQNIKLYITPGASARSIEVNGEYADDYTIKTKTGTDLSTSDAWTTFRSAYQANSDASQNWVTANRLAAAFPIMRNPATVDTSTAGVQTVSYSTTNALLTALNYSVQLTVGGGSEPSGEAPSIVVKQADGSAINTSGLSKTYGNAPFALRAELTNLAGPVTWKVYADNNGAKGETESPAVIMVSESGQCTIKGAGTAWVTAKVGETESAAVKITVAKMQISLNLNTAKSKTYGGADAINAGWGNLPTGAYSGTLDLTMSRDLGEDAGKYQIWLYDFATLGVARPTDAESATAYKNACKTKFEQNNPNYTLNLTYNYQEGNFTINEKELKSNTPTLKEKNYDGTTTATLNITAPVGNIVSADNNDGVTVVYSGTFDSPNVKYDGTTVVNQTGSITATLTGSKVKNYKVPVDTSDTTWTKTVTDGEATIVMVRSNLSAKIKPIALTYKAPTVSKVYDGTTAAPFTVESLIGLTASDQSNAGSLSAVFADKNVGDNKTFTLVSAGDKITLSNYTYPSTFVANITPKPLSVTGLTAFDKVYDGTVDAVLSGTPVINTDSVIPGDTVSIASNSELVGEFYDKNVGNKKSVVVKTSLGLSGKDAGNYYLQPTDTMQANITPATLTITPDVNQYKSLGALDPAFTYTYEGLAESDKKEDGTAVSGILRGALSRVAGEASGEYAFALGSLTASSNYKLVLSADAPKFAIRDTDATLKAISVSGGTLTPTFNPEVMEYTVKLPMGVTAVPAITAEAVNSAAHVQVTDADSLSGNTVITVTAADGMTVKTYTIRFSVAEPVSVTAVVVNASSGGNNGMIIATGSGGSGSYEFNLDNSIWQSGSTFDGKAAGSYTLYVRDREDHSNTAQISVTVGTQSGAGTDVPAPTTLTADTASPVIPYSAGSLNVELTAGGVEGAVYRYYIYSGTGIINGNILTVTTPGAVTIRAEAIKDGAISTGNKSLTLHVEKASAVSMTAASQNVTTYGGKNGSITVTASGGLGTYQYRVGNGSWGISGTFSGLAAGMYTVSVRDAADTANIISEAITITQADATDAAAINAVLSTLTLGDTSAVTESLVLPASETYGGKTVSISWATSDSGVVSADGTVTRPSSSAGNKTVILTATVTCGDITRTKTFEVTVLAKAASSSGGGSGSGSNSYTVSVDSGRNGSVSVSPKNASKGTTVTITVKPDKGYELDELTVTDSKGNELKLTKKSDTRYTFTMPSGKVTVEASFVEIEDAPDEGLAFVDVPANAYYADAVAWAVENGITSGTSATTFSPNAACTRAQMVTFLWRAAGSPKAAGNNPFTDLDASAYYYDAVLWAVSEGITSGTSATTFGPNDTVTRGQTVTFLYRASGSPASSGNSFADVAPDAYYANAVAWAVSEGITSGTGNNAFSPDADCTRGQIVTFMYRNMA